MKNQNRANFKKANQAVGNLTEKEQKLFDELRSRSKNSWDNTFNTRAYRGFFDNVINKYPESAHFIYELLQNADDAHASKVSIFLYKDHLIFKHNGTRHFNITESYENDSSKKIGDVNSILSIGDSTKIGGTNTIGKYGIGFKSVYQYTDAPEIYDDKFKFRIDHYIIPTQLNNDNPLREHGETLFLLKFKSPENDYKHIFERLNDLDSPILFLQHLKEIKWINKVEDDKEKFYRKTIKKISEENETKFELIIEFSGVTQRKLLLFTKSINIPNLTEKYEICVGYYLNATEDLIDTNEEQKIFCYFKTDDHYNGCFICHAPFELIDSRSQIKRDSEVNKYLAQEIANLAATSLLWIKDYGSGCGKMLLKNLFNIIPYDYSFPKDDIYNSYINVLKDFSLLPSRNSIYLSNDDAYIGTSDMKKLLSRSQLQSLTNNAHADFILMPDNNDKLKYYLKYELNIQEFNILSIAKNITSEFMEAQTETWIKDFYDYLDDHARKYFKSDSTLSKHERIFWYAPIVKDSEGKWAAPYKQYPIEPAIYLPFSNNAPLTGYNYKFIDKTYAYNDKINKFFVEMGLHEPNVIDFIKEAIMPKYDKDDLALDDNILLQDFDTLYNIYNTYKDEPNKPHKEEIRNLLHEKYRLKCKTNSKEECYLFLSIDNIFDDTEELKSFYEGVDDIYFIDYDFYMESPCNKNKEDIQKWFRELGLNKYSKIVCSHDKCNITEKQTHYLYLYHWDSIDNYIITGLDKVNWNVQNSHFVWESLFHYDIDEYKNIRFYKFYKKNTKEFATESTLIENLREYKWICNTDGTFCTPADISPDDFHKLKYQENNELEEIINLGANVIEEETHLSKELFSCFKTRNDIEQFISSYKNNQFSISNIEKEVRTNYYTNQDLIEYSITEDEEPSKIRKTIHYIGVKLYEHFLDKLEINYSKPENGEKYDFNIGGKYITVLTTGKSSHDDMQIYLTSEQHKFIEQNNLPKYNIVRISLKDLGIRYKDIRDIYGNSEDIDTNDRLKNRCDKIASDYWSSARIEDFERLCQEYAIKITKEEYK